MPDNSPLQQLANRARIWHGNTGISQSLIATKIGVADGNYSAFLSGKRGIGAESTCLLLEFINMPRREAIARFSSKPIATSKILNLQERGKSKMLLDNDGWVAGGQSGSDPNGTSTVDTTDDADTSTAAAATVLRQVRSLHRAAIRAINVWLVNSKVNKGSTPVNTNQRFSACRILKSIRFAKADDSDDTTSATQDLLDTLGTLDVVTRRKVVGAILQAFPNSASIT